MTDIAKVLVAVEPRAKPAIISGLVASWADCVALADLSKVLRQAHFLAQCAHESDGFRTTVEYASGRAYEGRADLGNTAKGDGVRCKGRALIQNTGAAIYRELSRVFGVDFYANPAKMAEFPWAALTSAYFWKAKHLNALADRDDIDAVTHRVNGGLNGLASRKTYLARAKHALTDLKGALTARAQEETTKAKAKSKAAAGAAASGISTVGAAPVAVEHVPAWVIAAVVAALVALLVALIVAVRSHRNTADVLSAAAQEA